MRWKPERTQLVLVSATESELSAADDVASRFGGAHPQALPLANEMRGGIRRGSVKRRTIEQFSKWLNTGGSYDTAQMAAQDLSVALFGRVIERMLDQSNKPTLMAGVEWARLRGAG